MRRAFQYRLYTTKLQAEILGLLLEGARSLYNAALEQRRTGRRFVRVPAPGTSSSCFECGAYRKKLLSEREHRCPCGLVLDRDLHASLNILRLGRSLRDSA
jgi:putative transposase